MKQSTCTSFETLETLKHVLKCLEGSTRITESKALLLTRLSKTKLYA